MDRPDRDKIHEITSLLARRIVGEATKKNSNGAVIVGFNTEADKKLIALFPDEEDELEVVGMIRKQERKRIKSLALQAIADEPEFPGDMPDELWKEIDGDREITQRVMQNTVRITKRDITDRLLQVLEEEK